MLIAGAARFSLSPMKGALLALLAIARDKGLSRAHVMELLWDSGPSSRLRHRTSQLIYSLNREFPGQLVVTKRHRHYLSERIGTDYQRFEAAMSSNRLSEAMEFLRSGFLSDLTQPPSEAFSDWLDKTRLELGARIREAAVEQGTRLQDQGAREESVEAARVLLSLNSHDERALQMLIRAEAGVGRVREAEAAFKSFVERSQLDDRDWVPQAETVSLVDRIRDMPARAYTQVGGHTSDSPPLTGRAEELAALSAAMLPTPEDGLRLVVIRGERGIGKTRLVEESLTTDLLSGIRVLRCRASRTGRRAFLNSVVDALASSDIGSDLRDLGEPWRTTMLALLAEPDAAARRLFEPSAVEPDRVYRRYLEALGRLLVQVARNEPTILFIDDFHTVAEDATAVLRHVVRHRPFVPLVVTVAVATEGTGAMDSLARLLRDSPLQCGPTEFSIGELTREAATELVDTLAERGIEEEARDRIVELSDRNPFFLLKLALPFLVGSRLPNLDPDNFVPVPESISDVFSSRLAELDDDTERILQLLSVLGRPLSVGRLSRLIDRSRASCEEALDRLQRCRLVRKGSRGFAVRYELVRHTTYHQMSPGRRIWAHGPRGTLSRRREHHGTSRGTVDPLSPRRNTDQGSAARPGRSQCRRGVGELRGGVETLRARQAEHQQSPDPRPDG